MNKRLLLLTAAALLAAALPAGAGVSIDRTSPSVGGCGFLVSPSQVFSLVPPGTGGCDVGGAGPTLDVGVFTFGLIGTDNIDALSTNTLTPAGLSYSLVFSADRASVGQPATPFAAEAANNQAASDLWRTLLTGGSPAAAMAACAPVAVPAPHFLRRNQTEFNLGRTAAAGTAVGPAQDNVDAVELDVLDVDGDFLHDFDVYFSLDAASPSLGGSPADILISAASSVAFGLFAPAGQLGLLFNDDIDSLVIWDRAVIGMANPNVDFALFSLAPGSPTLAGLGLSPAAIFVTDFNGAFCLFAPANQLGLLATDNVDGLDVMP